MCRAVTISLRLEIDCGQPEDIVNGRTDSSDGTVFQRISRYYCNGNAVLLGSRSRVCQKNGLWSGAQPVCVDFSGEKHRLINKYGDCGNNYNNF